MEITIFSLSVLEEFLRLFQVDFLVGSEVVFFFNCRNWTYRFASPAIDADIRIDIEHIRSFFNAIHRTDTDALAGLLPFAWFQYYKSHLFVTSLNVDSYTYK